MASLTRGPSAVHVLGALFGWLWPALATNDWIKALGDVWRDEFFDLPQRTPGFVIDGLSHSEL